MNFVQAIYVNCWKHPTIGFGKMSSNIMSQFSKNGIKVSSSEDVVDLELLITTLHGANKVKKKSIFYTMWESSILPKGSVENINRAKLVIVPSLYNQEIFKDNGVVRPIITVPLGVDVNIYRNLETPKGRCVFGMAGVYHVRKNIPFVIKTFKKAFDGKDAVLKIKTPATTKMFLREIVHPQIEYIAEDFSESVLCQWYNSLDAFVSCSHGEGWGLHQLEAMSCGVPLISPKFGGVVEYFDETVGYCVDYSMSAPKGSIYEGEWCDAKEDSLIEAMLSVYNNRDEARRLGLESRKRACQFTWGNCVDKLVNVVNSHILLKLG